jgi:hypothetical protein
MFDILVDVHERYPFTKPAAPDERSEEWIDEMLGQLDDTDRHVVELAPSVLSPTQVAYLFRAYDHMSRERIDLVEWQKNRKADRPDEDFGWMTPGRWSWRSFEP